MMMHIIFWLIRLRIASIICITMIDALFELLGYVADFRTGYPFRGAIEPVEGGTVAVVQIKDVAPSQSVAWEAVVRTELKGRRAPEWLASGDVLLVARGNRYYAVALDSVPDSAVCGPHLYHLRLKGSAGILPQFLAWQINQPPIQRLLGQAAEGSNQLSIRRAELEGLPISVPTLAIQEHIVRLSEVAERERALLSQLVVNRDRQMSALAFALNDAATREKN
jgi:hypothetical protein